jgi:PQQ enzyme repeat
MNIAVGITGSKHLAETDSTDISVGWVGPDPAAQAEALVDHISANADSQNALGKYCENCAHSFETDPSSSLDLENRWRWPVSYRSIEVLAIIIDILIILSAGVLAAGVLAAGVLAAGVLAAGVLAAGVLAAGVLADAIYRLGTTKFSSTSTDYAAAPAVIAALFTLLKCHGLYKPMVKVNRGLAILDNSLFVGSLDGYLVAINGNTGKVKWQTRVAK